jgi:hypothetical protein
MRAGQERPIDSAPSPLPRLGEDPNAVQRCAFIESQLAEFHYANEQAKVGGKIASVGQLLAEARSQRGCSPTTPDFRSVAPQNTDQ